MAKISRKIVWLSMELALVISACSVRIETATVQSPSAPAPVEQVQASTATAIPPTPVPPTPENTATPSPLPPAPVETPTPAPPIETPIPAPPMVTALELLNIRSGPDAGYERVGQLQPGSAAVVSGRNIEGTWWQIEFPDAASGSGWVKADYVQARNTESVPVVDFIPPTPAPVLATPTPIIPPTPTPAPFDFVVKAVRLWSNEENGGSGLNGSVTNCGYGHNVFITVVDAAGNPLDGVVLEDSYKTLRQISGSRGPGRAEYIFWSNGYQLQVVEYQGAGRPVTSELSPLVSPKDEEIPIPWLMDSHYCATVEECELRISQNSLCRGHYSYDMLIQRTW